MRGALVPIALALGVLSGCIIVAGQPPPPPAAHHGLPPSGPPRPPPPPFAPVPPSPVPAPLSTLTIPQLLTALPTATFEPPPPPTGRAEVLPPGLNLGHPPQFTPQAPAGYWLWQGPRGSWMLRITTAAEYHDWSGTLSGTRGVIRSVSPTSAALADRVRQLGAAWVFSFRSATHADGFTFDVEGDGCVDFDLRFDGAPATRRVFVGAAQVQPITAHFVVCPSGRKP